MTKSKQRAAIVRLAQQGLRTTEIARRVRLCRNTIARIRKQAGVSIVRRHLRPELEAEALELLRAGAGYTAVARRLGVPRREVKALQLVHGLRARMDRRPRPDADLAGFIEALRNREGHVKHLAKKFRIDEERGLRIAHRELGVVHFKRGRNPIPLQHARDWPRGVDVAENRELTQ